MKVTESTPVDQWHVLLGLLLIPIVAYLFFGVSVVCDGYLSPNLTGLCKHLDMANEVGAATLLALGASAPELAISCVGVSKDETEVTIPAVVAVGTLTFGLVPGLLLLRAKRDIQVDVLTASRDGFFFVGALVLLAVLMHKTPFLGWREACGMVFAYVAYLAAVVGMAPVESTQAQGAKPSAPLVPDKSQTDPAPGSGAACRARVLSVARKPFEAACQLTVRGGPIQQFATTVVWISLLSYAAVEIALFMSYAFGASKASVGVVVLALGSQLPDLVAAIDLSDKVEGGASVGLSQAGASQVLNLTLGLGAPILVSRLFSAAKVHTTNADNVVALSFFCIAMTLAYVALVLAARRVPSPARFRPRILSENATILKPQALLAQRQGLALILICLAFYTLSVVYSETDHYPLISRWDDSSSSRGSSGSSGSDFPPSPGDQPQQDQSSGMPP